MSFPAITSAYAALLALVYVALSFWVVAGRATFRTLHGDGGHAALNRRIRAHANFAEFVPLCLFLVALYEGRGGNHTIVHGLLMVLLIARIAHPVGMVAAEGTMQQYACRGASVVATMLVLSITALLLLAAVV